MQCKQFVLSLSAILVCIPGISAAQTKVLPAVDISAADVQTQLDPARKTNALPNIRVVDAGGHNIAVGALTRKEDQPQPVAVHYKVSEIYHVLSGEATLVTGGTVINPKVRPADSAQVKQQDGPGETGTAIEGGTSRQIKAGDIVVIPAGTPHTFSKINGAITYIVIRIDPDQILTLH